ncbi:hypothetical protein K445DRAFT_316363 [Daldinia sp. EC12]|nr:hypothetical protein F4774DRAFT_389988 [Daldinia eschscholtzii]OTB16859.1 hypothetical protein K445DRAFT_316363 [Daldinia sp. EC12]
MIAKSLSRSGGPVAFSHLSYTIRAEHGRAEPCINFPAYLSHPDPFRLRIIVPGTESFFLHSGVSHGVVGPNQGRTRESNEISDMTYLPIHPGLISSSSSSSFSRVKYICVCVCVCVCVRACSCDGVSVIMQ